MKPNIIYILADDMGYGDVSCLNPKSKIQTRHLDKLAADGMKFTDAHSSSAVCTPSRYSILTGRYNWRSKLKQGVLFGYDGPVIEPSRMTVASYLRDHGYETNCIGKWHLGWNWAKCGDDDKDIDFTRPISAGPTDCGFDHFFGIIGSLDMPPYVYVKDNVPTAVPDQMTDGENGKHFFRPGPVAPNFKHEDVLPEFTRRAVDFVEHRSDTDRPFFLYLPLPAPHTPILPSKPFHGRSGIGEYGDFCLQVDDIVGQIVTAVERTGCDNNTIIVFTSDNGCSPAADIPEMIAQGHNPSHHFRGHKADIYEGGHRIPLIVKWPLHIAPAGSSEETVCLSDLFATIADIVGTPLPDNAGEDSVSNLPLWTGSDYQAPLRDTTVHSSLEGAFSIRQGVWKLEMCPGSGGWSWPQPGDEPDGWPSVQLYRLDGDIGEQVNLAEREPSKVEELKNLLTGLIEAGRSTPGAPQENEGGKSWPQVWWTASQQVNQ